MTPLPSDTQRCHGAGLTECANCYRRTTPPTGWPFLWYWTPPENAVSPCGMFLKEPTK